MALYILTIWQSTCHCINVLVHPYTTNPKNAQINNA
jgi:hypothetical protein